MHKTQIYFTQQKLLIETKQRVIKKRLIVFRIPHFSIQPFFIVHIQIKRLPSSKFKGIESK